MSINSIDGRCNETPTVSGFQDMSNISFLPIVKSVLPASWHIEANDGLYAYSSPKSTLQIPDQGWKLYVSCNFFNAQAVIRDTAALCVELGVPFKFVRSRFLLATQILGKSVPLEESGKAVILYPADPEACHTALLGLAQKLNGIEAPPVLSGRRFAATPVYYRYGANTKRAPDGYFYLRHPETGERIRDPMRPEIPPWINTDPFQPDLDLNVNAHSDSESFLEVGQFTIQEAISFSNSGGIYLATDTTNRYCCIKEGCPWMAPHPETGEDAFARLAREAETLKKANTANVSPEFIGFFTDDEHAFLVREYIEGETLADRIQRAPFSTNELTTLANALEVGILELQQKIPDTRLDLSPQNVIFDGTTIKVIDFETDTVGSSGEYTWGTHGFIPPPGVCPWRWGIQTLLNYCANPGDISD